MELAQRLPDWAAQLPAEVDGFPEQRTSERDQAGCIQVLTRLHRGFSL